MMNKNESRSMRRKFALLQFDLRWGSRRGSKEESWRVKRREAAGFRQTLNPLNVSAENLSLGLIWWTAPIITRPQETGITQLQSQRIYVLTQPLAVLGGRRRQAGDSASVTPQVLLLCCRGNVPHLHCGISTGVVGSWGAGGTKSRG